MNQFGPYSKNEMANFCLNLVIPRIKVALRRMPKGEFTFHSTTKVRQLCYMLDKLLSNPKNAELRNIVNNAIGTNNQSPDMRYYTLATYLKNAI